MDPVGGQEVLKVMVYRGDLRSLRRGCREADAK